MLHCYVRCGVIKWLALLPAESSFDSRLGTVGRDTYSDEDTRKALRTLVHLQCKPLHLIEKTPKIYGKNYLECNIYSIYIIHTYNVIYII